MFTHLFQLWLAFVVIGIAVFAILTAHADREAEADQRANAADAHARRVIKERVKNGEYINATPEDLQREYDRLYFAHLQIH